PWLCQKIAASGFSLSIQSLSARASGSEKACVPALTISARQVLVGFHLQSKFRLRSTPLALKRPMPVVLVPSGISERVKRPSLPITSYKPSGFADGITVTERDSGSL